MMIHGKFASNNPVPHMNEPRSPTTSYIYGINKLPFHLLWHIIDFVGKGNAQVMANLSRVYPRFRSVQHLWHVWENLVLHSFFDKKNRSAFQATVSTQLKQAQLDSKTRDLVLQRFYQLSLDPHRWAKCIGLEKASQGFTSLLALQDGRIALGSENGTLRICNPAALKEEAHRIFKGHTKEITQLIALPDGEIASGSADTTIRIWNPDAPNQKPIIFKGHKSRITQLIALPNGKIASGCVDGTICIWNPDAPNQKPIIFKEHKSRITQLIALPDGKIASVSRSITIRIWNPDDLEENFIIFKGHKKRVLSLILLPEGKIASGSVDGTICIWDLAAPNDQKPIIFKDKDCITQLIALPDGRIASGSPHSEKIRVWNPDAPEENPIILKGHGKKVLSLVLLPDGKIVSASQNNICIWDLAVPKKAIFSKDLQSMGIIGLIALPDGRIALGLKKDKTAALMILGRSNESLVRKAIKGLVKWEREKTAVLTPTAPTSANTAFIKQTDNVLKPIIKMPVVATSQAVMPKQITEEFPKSYSREQIETTQEISTGLRFADLIESENQKEVGYYVFVDILTKDKIRALVDAEVYLDRCLNAQDKEIPLYITDHVKNRSLEVEKVAFHHLGHEKAQSQRLFISDRFYPKTKAINHVLASLRSTTPEERTFYLKEFKNAYIK